MGRIWASGCVLGALALILSVSVLLIDADLLWVLPAPAVVLVAALATAAAPGLVPALRAGGRWRVAPVITFVVAALAGCVVVGVIAPSGRVLARVLADVAVPVGAGPIETSGCRYCFRWLGSPPPPQARREIETDHVESVCREVTGHLVRSGWKISGWPESGCGVTVVRPARFGTTYRVTVGRKAAGSYITAGGGTVYRDSRAFVAVIADR